MVYLIGFIIIINALPVLFLGQQNPDISRISGIPMGYLLWIILGLLIVMHSLFFSTKLKSHYFITLCYSLVFFFILIVQNLYVSSGNSFLFYAMSIVFFTFVHQLLCNICFKLRPEFLKKQLHFFINVYAVAIILGVIKFILGYAEDSNFFVFYNRNATALSLILSFCIVSAMKECKLISMKYYIIYTCIWFLSIVFIQSRTGLLGFILVLGVLHFKFKLKSIIGIAVMFSLLIGFTLSPLGGDLKQRLSRIGGSVESVANKSNNLTPKDNDYRRYVLLFSGIEILGDKWFMGTGLGTKNYLKYFNQNKYQTTPGLPHNFYLSYPAQMGIIVFLLFLLLMRRVNLPLFKVKGRSGKAFVIALLFYLFFNEYVLLPDVWFYSAVLCVVLIIFSKESTNV